VEYPFKFLYYLGIPVCEILAFTLYFYTMLKMTPPNLRLTKAS